MQNIRENHPAAKPSTLCDAALSTNDIYRLFMEEVALACPEFRLARKG